MKKELSDDRAEGHRELMRDMRGVAIDLEAPVKRLRTDATPDEVATFDNEESEWKIQLLGELADKVSKDEFGKVIDAEVDSSPCPPSTGTLCPPTEAEITWLRTVHGADFDLTIPMSVMNEDDVWAMMEEANVGLCHDDAFELMHDEDPFGFVWGGNSVEEVGNNEEPADESLEVALERMMDGGLEEPAGADRACEQGDGEAD